MHHLRDDFRRSAVKRGHTMGGDVVLAVGAREADTVGRVLRLIRSYDEDEPIQFRIIRRGSELTAEGFLQ